MSDGAKCRKCGADIEAGALFCSRCGQDQTMVGDESPTLAVTTAGTPVVPVRSTMRQALRDATLGEYEILSELGRGGMATVFLAHDIALDRKVAIKVMAPHLLEGEGMAERFKLEARTAAQLSHPHIIPIYAVKETAETLFFVMKFVEGRGLDEVIRKTGPLPIPMVKDILTKVGGALGYAHRRDVVHRDIKPGNIMIDDEGTPIVTDFGIAKVAETKGLTMTGTTIGTPSYMSPEQCEAKPVTGASDQYSLGIVAFEMLTGRVPFEGDSAVTTMYKHCHEPLPPLQDFRPDCPPELRETVVRMTAKKPEERWPSLEAAVRRLSNEVTPTGGLDPIRSELLELVKEGDANKLLARLSDPSQPAIPRTGPRAAAPRPARSRRGLAIAAALFLVAGVGGTLAVLQPWAGDAIEGAAAQPTPGETGQPTLASGSTQGTVTAPPQDDGGPLPSSTATPADADAGGAATPSSQTATDGQAPDAADATPATAEAGRSVTSVDIEGPAGPLLPGATARLTARALDARGQPVSGQSVQWLSSEPAVASVDAGGTVSAVGAGETVITASAGGVSSRYAITVADAPVARVQLTSGSLTTEIGRQETLRAEALGAGGEILGGRQITWTSSEPSVARVDGGVVTAVAAGTATIIATSEGRSAQADVTVRVPLRTAVDEIVAAYARALESRNVEEVRRVYPDMTAERAQALGNALRTMEGLRVDYTIDSVQEQTSLAAAEVSATYRFRADRRDFVQPTPLHFTFTRTTTSWRVTSIQ